MNATAMAQSERHQLADLFEAVGPDAPTLCAGWTTRDLVAHLLVRENRPDAALGILDGPLAGYAESVQDKVAREPYEPNVDKVRSGPRALSPFRLPGVDGAANLFEYLIHHEDVRRAVPGWQPRDLTMDQQNLVWSRLNRMARILTRKATVGVVLMRPDTGDSIVARKSTPVVQLIGAPVELLLRLYGRTDVQLTTEGAPVAIEAFEASTFGV